MADSETLTVRLDRSVKKRLETWGARLRRSKSSLVAEAIEEYLAVQEWQIRGIREAIDSIDRGQVVSHDRVKAWAKSLGSRRELPRPKPRRKSSSA